MNIKVDRSFFTSALFVSLIIGLATRFILMPITSYEYDSYFWGDIIQNINSGNGLYGLMGYYYLPPWGYLLGFFDMIWNSVMSMDVIGIRFTDLLDIEALDYQYHRATIVTPFFNVLFKLPMVICDVVVGYLVYRMVLSRTSDKKKAELAFALWFLCPVVIYMSGIQPMFDTISALFTVLCIILLMNRADILSGVMFAAAAMIKIFPALILPLLIVYILKSSENNEVRVKRCAVFLIGMIAASLLIMLPNIIQGNISDTLYFLVGRIGSSGTVLLFVACAVLIIFAVLTFVVVVKKWDDKGFVVKYFCIVLLVVLVGLFGLAVLKGNGISGAVQWLCEKIPQIYGKIGLIMIAAIVEFVLAIMFYMRNNDDVDDQMMKYLMCGLTATICAVSSPAPQYCIVLMPFLVYHIVVRDKGFMILWIVISVVATCKNLILDNFGLLTTLSEYFGVFSADWILSCMHFMDSPVMGQPLCGYIDNIGTMIYRIALLCVFVLSAERLLKRWPKAVSVIQKVKCFGHRRATDDC